MFLRRDLSDQARKAVIVKGFGGLGNRLLTLMNAIPFCQNGKRDISIDWSDNTYSQNGMNIFSELFTLNELNHVSLDKINIHTHSVTPPAWKEKLTYTSRELMFWYINSMPDGYNVFEKSVKLRYHKPNCPDSILVITHELDDPRKTFCRVGMLPFSLWFSRNNVFAGLFNKYITPVEELRNIITSFKRLHFSKTTIGVHVRASDNPQNTIQSLDIYFDHIDKIKNACNKCKIFLATDNREVRQLFIEKYKSDLIYRDQWLPQTPGDRAHANESCPDRLQHAKDTVVDLFLLSSTEYLIINSGSSFSKLALLIGTKKLKTIILGEVDCLLKKQSLMCLDNLKGYARTRFISADKY